jgi:hypothetical protein
MIKKLFINNLIILLSLFVLIAIITSSCDRTIYIFGSLAESNFYTYNNTGSYNYESSVDWSPKLAVQIGVATNIATFKEHINLRTEINTSFLGSNYEDVTYNVKGKINLIYAYAPVTMEFNTKTGFLVEAGIQPGLLLSAKDRIDGTSTYFGDYIRNFDFGIVGGIGYKFSNDISIGLRASLGFINISAATIDGKSNTVLALRGTYTLKEK